MYIRGDAFTDVSKYGGNDMKDKKKWHVQGFTLIEMLLVIFILSILILLFVPNLSKQKENAEQKGQEAIIKVVDTQAELYELNYNEKVSLSELLKEDYITEKQAESYRKYYGKNQSKTPEISLD